MTKKRKLPSPRVLRRLLDYDPETGELRWKARPVWMFRPGKQGRAAFAQGWNGRYAGKLALVGVGANGYPKGAIFDQTVLAHRVGWAIYYGEAPSREIDHINGNRLDNRICNLRLATRAENSRNQKRHSSNSSGVTGVHRCAKSQRWHAQITVNHDRVFLGLFDDKDKAIAARKAAEIKYGFHPNHGRS